MASITTIQPATAPLEREQPNTLENVCPTEESAARLFAIVHGLWPVTLASIRTLIALEDQAIRTQQASARRERDASIRALDHGTRGACAKMCGSDYCDTFGCMLDQSPPLEGDRTPSGGGTQ